jgi:diguanylate cyclase (GGDEF)-like protein
MFKSKLDTRIQEERLGTLVQNLPSSIISTLAVSSFIFYLIYNKVDTQLAVVWLLVIFTLSLIRSVHIYKINIRTDVSLIQEERFILLGIFLSGITFGSSIYFLFPYDDFAVQVLLFFLISAMIAGSVALYSMHILAFAAYSIPLILVFCYQAFMMNDLALVLFFIGSVYYAIMLITMIRVNGSILRSLKTQYLNQDLAHNLSQAKEELERSNNELTEENRVREETETRLNRLANYDPLTGLSNRHMFKEELKQSLKAAKHKGSRMALMFLDLDNFKIINDTLGHAMGDKLLIAASSRLKSLLDSNNSIARLGGDEFVIIINNADDDAKISLLADNIIELLEMPFIFDENEMFIGTSIGISLYPDNSDETETLLSYADTAMYTAKAKGKNNYQFFTSKMHEKILFRHDIETKLHHAIEKNEFRILYQPKIDVNTNKVIGAEALLRWEHKELGKISPSLFIPIAEESSLINQIGKWVIKRVCRDIARIKHDFDKELCISVNISSSQILHQNLPELLQENLDNNALTSRAIELEFTENMLIKQGRKSQQVLDRLSKMGIKLCIDDFGTGYSSLNYLKTLPIHALKIDKTFICDTPRHEGDCAIAKSIISLAGNLNLDVIAEGVENAEQLNFLKENGCSVIQGFYFSKPLDINAFSAYLNTPSVKTEQSLLS